MEFFDVGDNVQLKSDPYLKGKVTDLGPPEWVCVEWNDGTWTRLKESELNFDVRTSYGI